MDEFWNIISANYYQDEQDAMERWARAQEVNDLPCDPLENVARDMGYRRNDAGMWEH